MNAAASPSMPLGGGPGSTGIAGPAHHRGRRAPADRLWPSLSRPVIRPQPARGLDLAGEWMSGAAARLRSSRRLRRRAERVVAQAATLSSLAEEALDRRIEEARAAVMVSRDDAAAVDGAFAVAHEVVRRAVGLSLFVEQVMGALAMSLGCCAEMATGEGKTLTAILPAALEGWSGGRLGGVHVLTVNDYLARRDAQTTGPAYRRLGLRVGFLQDSTPPEQRRQVYLSDVVYAADKQVIFDHLRDRLVAPLRPSLTGHVLDQVLAAAAREADGPFRPGAHPGGAGWGEQLVQRGLHAAIVDEADSILIDEAITPAIIAATDASGTVWGGEAHYRAAAKIAHELEPGADYTVDLRMRDVILSDSAREKLEARAGSLPAFWAGPRRREELVHQALMAKELYRLGDDYIIRERTEEGAKRSGGRPGEMEVVIVDRSTGRVLEGRKWQLGLHQAVEAKEGVPITGVHLTSSRSSYQRFFQRYRRLSGMTGTAWEVRQELWRDYRLPVVRIPTHRPVIRTRLPDAVVRTEQEKFERLAARAAQLHAEGRPVLIGTRSVEASERLGAMLAQRGVACRILNATREAEEAAIVAQAGKLGAVTVATNMAGRGTDILLEPATRQLGGLAVLASERHDVGGGRVDRQLFGRAGRQGDPGLAQAIVSLEDPVVVRHGLWPLVVLARGAVRGGWASGPVRRWATRLLWWQAQATAGRRAAIQRREVSRQDAWLEMAMHQETR